MKRKLNIYLRLAITITLILIQVVLFSILLVKFTKWAPAITIIMYIFSLLVLLYIIGNDDEAGYKIAWIIVVLVLSPVGGILYLLFGGKRPLKKMHDKISKEHLDNSKLLVQDEKVYNEIENKSNRISGLVSYLNNTAKAPAYANTYTKYFPLGENMFEEMLNDLKQAKHFIFMEYFIIDTGHMWDTLLDVLTERAKAGVDVRLIYDDFGSLVMLPGNYPQQLAGRGIKCIAFNPLTPAMAISMNNRDHRKIMVIDGHTAFNGGINIADEYINRISPRGIWKDTGLIIKGYAAWSFTLMFLEIWNAMSNDPIKANSLEKHNPANSETKYETDGYVQPFGDSPFDENCVGEDVYVDILNQAKNYVYIFTPYLIISEKMKTALALAAKRGVDVRLTTPGIPDKKTVYMQTRSYYKGLLKSGVRIFEYTPGFLHAKSFVSDDKLGVVGTINLDYRSLYLHFECATLLIGTSTVMDLKNDTVETLSQCREVMLGDSDRGVFGSLFDSIVRVVAPLM